MKVRGTEAIDLDGFIEQHLEGAGSDLVAAKPGDFVPVPEGSFPKVKSKEVRAWALEVHSLWKNLSRKVSDEVKGRLDLHTLLSLPGRVVILGSRFREVYYWDSYWVIRYFLTDSIVEEVTFGWPRQKASPQLKEQLTLGLTTAIRLVIELPIKHPELFESLGIAQPKESCFMGNLDGPKRRCGAVSGLTTVKNPVSLAHLVMEKSPHSYLAFEGVKAFARQQGVELADNEYFITEENVGMLKHMGMLKLAKEANTIMV